ncbi:MAG: RluA family pseudouridine synthase [Agathobacter sp.]|nr:RluA family pseudouridine synthase [Agathobacter sp.]
MVRELEIIFEDRDILICRKPAGVATQTKRLGQQDMESLLKNYRARKGEPPYIGVVHRLDQPVEGIMVFAKNQQAAAHLSKQVQERVIGKYYYALLTHACDLYLYRPEGVLEDYLITDKKTNFTRAIEEEEWKHTPEKLPKEAKYAKLEYKYLESKSNSLFEIKLHTGRQHQIRVQMAHAGCPLVGDSKYGEAKDGEQLALCSYKLEFEHPTKKVPMKFEIQPLGKVFIEFFQ